MKVEDLLQIAVVDEDDAVTFQNEFNKRIRELANYPHNRAISARSSNIISQRKNWKQ